MHGIIYNEMDQIKFSQARAIFLTQHVKPGKSKSRNIYKWYMNKKMDEIKFSSGYTVFWLV